MRRRDFNKVVVGSAVTWPLAARAQQPERMRRLGIVAAYTESDATPRSWIAALVLLEDARFVGLIPGGLRPEFLLGFGQTISLCHCRFLCNQTASRNSDGWSAPSSQRNGMAQGPVEEIPESVTPTPKKARPLDFHYPLAQFL